MALKMDAHPLNVLSAQSKNCDVTTLSDPPVQKSSSIYHRSGSLKYVPINLQEAGGFPRRCGIGQLYCGRGAPRNFSPLDKQPYQGARTASWMHTLSAPEG